MAPPLVSLKLSKFEQIEILRAEIELRDTELKQVEKQIRAVLFEVERQRFLQTLHSVFQQLTPPEHAAHLPELEANREALFDALAVMQSALKNLETETTGQTAPPSRSSGMIRPAGGINAPKRAKFDSFDDFKASKSSGDTR